METSYGDSARGDGTPYWVCGESPREVGAESLRGPAGTGKQASRTNPLHILSDTQCTLPRLIA